MRARTVSYTIGLASMANLLLPCLCAAAPLQMIGSIDSHYAIKMSVELDAGKIKGSYRYLPKGSDLVLHGTYDPAGHVNFTESDEHGATTGVFDGRIVDNKRIVGTWTKQRDKQKLPFIVVREQDPSAMDGGKDGIVITEEKKQIPKGKGNEVRNPTFISYPVVMKETFTDGKIANQLQNSLSLDKIFGVKNIIKDALDGTDTWTEQIDYNVHYNRNYLVDVEFTISGEGAYPDSTSKQVVVNAKTGNRVTAADVFEKSSLPALKQIVSALRLSAVNKAFKENADDKEASGTVKDLVAGHSFTISDLNNFAIDDRGVTFLYNWDFPHVAKAQEPNGEYFVPFSKLASFIKADGPLAVFVSTKR